MAQKKEINIHNFIEKFPYSKIDFGINTLHAEAKGNTEFFFKKPHRHDSYFLKYIINGTGIHSIDFVDYEIKPNSLFIMAPGQVHSFEMYNVEGFYIYFKSEMLDLENFPLLNSSFNSPALYFEKEEQKVGIIFNELFEEFNSQCFAKNILIKAYLQSLLILMTRHYLKQEGKANTLPKHIKSIKALNEIINQNFIEQRSISFYSNALYMSSRQLNNILQENIGKSISDLIHQRLLVESKRLLCYTDKTISEIAYNLNFTDKTYFHRFFKKNEKITPLDFRKKMTEENSIS